jgi:hypothetical protein
MIDTMISCCVLIVTLMGVVLHEKDVEYKKAIKSNTAGQVSWCLLDLP